MATAAQMVTSIDAAILALVEGGATAQYGVGSERWQGYSLAELQNLREYYQGLSDRESGAAFRLARRSDR